MNLDQVLLDTANNLLIQSSKDGDMDSFLGALRDGATDYGKALLSASKNGNLNIVMYLVEGDFPDLQVQNAFSASCAKGNRQIIDYLASKWEQGGIQLNFDFAIQNAIGGGQKEIFTYLLRNFSNHMNLENVLRFASTNPNNPSNNDAIRILHDFGVRENNAMKIIISKHSLNLVKHMLPSYSLDTRCEALEFACQSESRDLIICILESGGDECDTFNVYIESVKNDRLDMVKILLDFGNIDREAGLGYACLTGKIDFVVLLIDTYKVDPNAGVTNACLSENPDVVLYLIQNGADPAFVLQETCRFDKTELVVNLLENGIDPFLVELGVEEMTVDGYQVSENMYNIIRSAQEF